MKKINNILFTILFLTFWTYSLPNVRLYNQPISVFVFPPLFVIFLYECIKGKKIKLLILFSICLIIILSAIISTLINLPHNWHRLYISISFIIIFYLTTYFISSLDFSIFKYLIILYLSSIFIFLYGVYGFFNWDVGEFIQHTFGYFGITYTDATRNGDMLFLFIPFWYSFFTIVFNKLNHFWKSINLVILILISTGIIFSFARGAWISLFLTFIIIILISFKTNVYIIKRMLKKILLFILVSFFAAFLLIPLEVRDYVSNRFISIFNPEKAEGISSNAARKDIFTKSYKIFINDPFFGVGQDNVSRFLTYDNGATANHAENMFLTILLENGIFGLFIFMLFSFFFMRNILKIKKKNFYYFYSISVFFTFLFYGLFNLMIDSLWFWVNLGISYALIIREIKKQNIINADC
jgi:O-antigen ligase